MKILCDRQQLQEAFALVGSVSPQKTTKTILQSVHLQTGEDQTLTLYATDQEMSAKVVLESVKVSKPGSCLLPARQTMALLRELDDSTVSLKSKDHRTTIESGGGSFVLLGEDPDQFPEVASLEDGPEVVIGAARFAAMVQQTAFSAAREETRYAINGALMELSDSCLRMVATDGRRLALNYENLPGDPPDFRAVVPLRALNAVAKAVNDGETDEIKINVGKRQIGFTYRNTQLISQLLESRFPEYEGVIPKAADSSIEIDRDLLEKNLRKVAIMSSGDVRMVRFEFGQATLQLSAESSDVGRADLTMDISVKGPGGAINFNPDFVLDALRNTSRETVLVDMTDEATPAKFTLGEAFTYVLMPISGS